MYYYFYVPTVHCD